jgi:D-serine deaminase-like pyridoxal phosphate-dependent protein
MPEITRPTLLLDEKKCKRNIARMAEKAGRHAVKLIPHMKTPQSHKIAGWCADEGVEAITVSSVKMAGYFARDGWRDITIAFPVNVLEIKAINDLLDQGVDLKLFLLDEQVALRLDGLLSAPAKVLIDLDAGYHRTGLSTDDIPGIEALARTIAEAKNLELYGLYFHPGNTYHSHNIEEIRQIWSAAIRKVNYVRTALGGIKSDLKVRMGDTPGCTLVEQMEGVDEISAGNFIFYDLVMNYLDVCDEEDIAVAVACPVVAKNTVRREIVMHGGAVHFSKDHLFDQDEQKFFGEVVILQEGGWSPVIAGVKVKSLSQEHGILAATDEVFDQIQVGDVLGILPIHSCLTANLMKSYTTLTGELIDHMEGVC